MIEPSGQWRWTYGTGQLPPRPDATTGEPFPPHGLAYFESETERPPELDRDRETRLSRKPRPPEGRGSVLAWYTQSDRGRIVGFFVALGIMIALMPLASMLSGGGPFEAFGAWPIWIICLATAILISRPLTRTAYVAGADWFMIESTRFGRKKRNWVDLYDLTEVDAMFAGGGFHLTLEDKKNTIGTIFLELQADRRVWDLIYNGILHSVADGAKINTTSIGILQLDHTPALQLRNSWHRRHSGEQRGSEEQAGET